MHSDNDITIGRGSRTQKKMLGDFFAVLEAAENGQSSLPLLESLLVRGELKAVGNDKSRALQILMDLAVQMGANQTYAKILRGAAEIMGDHGISVSVEDILKVAGISRRTFYQFFSNREELLLSLYSLICSLLTLSVQLRLRRQPRNLERSGTLNTCFH